MRKFAGARADRTPEMTLDKELIITYTKTMKKQRWKHKFDVIRSKDFNFYSIISVLIAKLKSKYSQKSVDLS